VTSNNQNGGERGSDRLGSAEGGGAQLHATADGQPVRETAAAVVSGVSQTGSARASIAGAVAIVLLLSAIVVLQIVRERTFARNASAADFLYLTSPAVATRLALSYDAVVADLYWMRAIQYFGGNRLAPDGDKSYALLYPLLDLTTSLDPHFSMAYRFGAFFLSEETPGGAGRVDLAVRLLEKARRAHPQRWEYPHDIGFIYYRERDFATAAQWFRRAADVQDAPPWLGPLAAVTLASGGDTRSSRLLWRQLLESEADWLRQLADYRLGQLDAIDQAAQLEQLAAAYLGRFGQRPASWEQMVRAGLLRSVPLDPAGHPYVLDAFSGKVTVSERSPLWPLPTDRPS
jgi:tetratricopeptide (TPR) repeat protein